MRPSTVTVTAGRTPSVSLAIAAVVGLGVLFGCTGAPPETTRVETTLVYVQDTELDAVYEELTVAAHISDADGIDDVVTIHIVHNESGYVWTTETEEWRRLTEEGTELFLVEGLVTPDGSSLPRGRYRLIALDTAGHESEASFTLSDPPAPTETLRFPEIRVEDGVVEVDGPFEESVIYGYREEDGRMLGEAGMSPTIRRPVDGISWLGGSEDVELFVTAYDTEGGRYVRSGPYTLP